MCVRFLTSPVGTFGANSQPYPGKGEIPHPWEDLICLGEGGGRDFEISNWLAHYVATRKAPGAFDLFNSLPLSIWNFLPFGMRFTLIQARNPKEGLEMMLKPNKLRQRWQWVNVQTKSRDEWWLNVNFEDFVTENITNRRKTPCKVRKTYRMSCFQAATLWGAVV